MKSMCHFAAKIPAPHDHSNMLKIHAVPRNPPVRQSLDSMWPFDPPTANIDQQMTDGPPG